ncbi:MAG: lipocalin family protein [Chitinophagaceae bacterium]|jgi:hypothetical protein
MKFISHILIAVLIPLLLLGSAFVLRSNHLSPEQMIMGNWKEVSWTYEKADNKGSVNFNDEPINDAMKHMISQSKIIHEAETWNFTPDSGLVLNTHHKNLNVDWALMGSSNILRLKYNDEFEEHYNLIELNEKRMVLHFENDRLTRGIVRITFEKI